jgi:hypothetical protein
MTFGAEEDPEEERNGYGRDAQHGGESRAARVDQGGPGESAFARCTGPEGAGALAP